MAGRPPVAAEFTITGLRDVQRAMRSVAPDLKRAMDREIRSHLQPVLDRARGHVPDAPPLSRWSSGPAWSGRLEWNGGAVRSGLSIRQGGRRARGTTIRSAWRVTNAHAAGNVFELAGRRSRGKNSFIRNLEAKHGQASRAIWAAWDELGGDGAVQRRIVDTIRRYEQELQARMDAAGDRIVVTGR